MNHVIPNSTGNLSISVDYCIMFSLPVAVEAESVAAIHSAVVQLALEH